MRPTVTLILTGSRTVAGKSVIIEVLVRVSDTDHEDLWDALPLFRRSDVLTIRAATVQLMR